MKAIVSVLAGLVLTLAAGISDSAAQDSGPPDVAVTAPAVALAGVPFSITLDNSSVVSARYRVVDASGRELAEGEVPGADSARIADLEIERREQLPLRVTIAGPAGGSEEIVRPHLFPGWISLLPPLIAIALALIFREVVLALFAGVWLGALFYAGLNPLSATWRTIDTFIVPSLANTNQASILVFSLLLGGMVGVMSRAGGTLGIVEAVRPLASTPRRAQFATYLGGLAIFFDDYANTLIVGNTFRPITDRLRVSREKLSYIVDSTAAPVAAIVFVSTWVGYEVSLIRQGLDIAAGQSGVTPDVAAGLSAANPFAVFIHSIPYLFYPILALLMVGLVIFTGRDFGPMLAAERRARSGGGVHGPDAILMVDTDSSEMQPQEGAPHRWYNAAIPVLSVIIVVLLGLYFDGRVSAASGSLVDILAAANPFNALLWGSLAGCILAIAMSVGQRILTLQGAISAWLAGMKSMMLAFVILLLAWSLGAVTAQLSTAAYLTGLLEGNLAPQVLPALVFITAGAIAFATGTSWATMAILLPLVIPLSVALGGAVGFEHGASYEILLATTAAVLAGSIFGDHCSPISDTTVLSSMASASDHVDHVRTQLPYALVVAVLAVVAGSLGTAYGVPWWIAYLVSGGALFGALRFFGGTADGEEGTASADAGAG